ncbi:MAG TPA: TIGR03086 family metal-binding protein [Actinomycetota bacterium]|nr:TIGR03086 family metal-binding protein [Actinomycetota bacterium]
MDADSFARAVHSSRPVLAAVRPEQLDDPTPCVSWKVRDLINHMVQAPEFAATVASTRDFSNHRGDAADHASGDYLAAYDAATERALEAFRSEGAFEGTVKMPFGDLPAAAFATIATGDAFVHGWDLAKATGQAATLDPALAEELLVEVEPLMPEGFRGADGEAPFGPRVEVADDAPAADRLAGFLGRHP